MSRRRTVITVAGDPRDEGWSCKFEDPISLPNGKVLITLKDAADYIMKLIARIAKGLGVPASKLLEA
ncbi:hypothetical protein [Bradyrhizobium erythrophlei]|jgi:hypothetical protein|uniref:Uncharacterized protein n=1 Tax=Bradyrhizobium erythrophlei TaxID=1437360 RepID=A0A1M7UUM0_9BRAD|nr:hypothetical protein [Bradyrhizobium erythrophlei]SHN86731.1 hypothetical protein SAMN05444170_6802 [Bradyrhizobium erythrophlei]